MLKIANVLGATGLVGGHLVQLLLEDDRYSIVRIFVRRPTGLSHEKLEEHLVDFDKPNEWHHLLTGDDLFSCMGTTIKKAGSQEAQYKVDFTYPFEAAQAAAANGVQNYALVSSSGANPNSKFFYMRIKGELDRYVQGLSFSRIRIIRPSILKGERDEKRLGESIGVAAMGTMVRLAPFLKRYGPIHGKVVAQALINSINREEKEACHIYEAKDVFTLGKNLSN
jgi:uncharacterized protein YbjT (DUF2867 family)